MEYGMLLQKPVVPTFVCIGKREYRTCTEPKPYFRNKTVVKKISFITLLMHTKKEGNGSNVYEYHMSTVFPEKGF